MQFAIKTLLARIWHAPEHFRLMDPLPPLHRRGIIFAALLIVTGFLWPLSDDNHRPVMHDEQRSTVPRASLQAGLSHPSNNTPAPPSHAAQQTQAPVTDIEQQWRSYRITSGQTLAQLFRDNKLPPADLYAMVQVEGNSKPLSNLQTGQMVQIRQNASGVVTGLTIDTGSDRQALFVRQADGSFLRAR